MSHPPFANATTTIRQALARALAPRKPLTVSQWSDAERRLSSKGSAEPGQWRTSRNPPLREPMDCLSARSPVREVVLMFPIQFGKSEIVANVLGYTMDHNPGPVMIALPGEVAMNKFIAQKLGPLLEETPAVRNTLTTVNTRDGANRRDFKDFIGGQLYIEHAGSPQRLKSTSVRTLIVDELDQVAANINTGDDPLDLLEGRTSAFPGTYKRLYVSTPDIKGISRVEAKWEESDQRRFHVPCPECGHEQPLEWSGLQWSSSGEQAWYVCRDCGSVIDERAKPAMIAAGDWVPEHPERKIRGYHLNCLYYQIGLGPRWVDLAAMWRKAQGDPGKLKVFINDRLAEPWEDPAMRAVKHNVIADRAEPYPLRHAPAGVLAVTAGVDTQDNRLAVHIIGWGRRMTAWTLDYVELPGDPSLPEVWVSLTELLNTPIEHETGALLSVLATCIDAGGHRTEDVYHYARSRHIRRPKAIFGAVHNNAPVLSKGKYIDVTYRGRIDRRSLQIHHVGTVAVKHLLYSRLSADAEQDPDKRLVRFSEDLPDEYFGGLVSETYNPSRNRFDKKRGARNEPLDTWVYAYAATHHPELRLHRYTHADWDRLEARLAAQKDSGDQPADVPRGTTASAETPARDPYAPIPMAED